MPQQNVCDEALHEVCPKSYYSWCQQDGGGQNGLHLKLGLSARGRKHQGEAIEVLGYLHQNTGMVDFFFQNPSSAKDVLKGIGLACQLIWIGGEGAEVSVERWNETRSNIRQSTQVGKLYWDKKRLVTWDASLEAKKPFTDWERGAHRSSSSKVV